VIAPALSTSLRLEFRFERQYGSDFGALTAHRALARGVCRESNFGKVIVGERTRQTAESTMQLSVSDPFSSEPKCFLGFYESGTG
jgi:hypothetical protein